LSSWDRLYNAGRPTATKLTEVADVAQLRPGEWCK
jgi:hypothetical protein